MPVRKKPEQIKYEQLKKLYSKLTKKQDEQSLTIKELEKDIVHIR